MRTVELTHVSENERAIFILLVRAVRNFSPEMELRVAGGWVRDKLLGQDSNDIDIAIENMLASDFLDKLNDYLRSQGEEEVQGKVVQCTRTKGNEQEVVLETVKMRLYNRWIDVVHLRSEEYQENSRIPVKVVFATPEVDASRRDFTINSLFYNLHTGRVQDFTGRGIDDLLSGTIVTPLPAQFTFLEDPLRVLRAIRFGARFGFTLDEQLIKAASSEQVRVALARNIRRERIGNEIDLMLSGNRPVSAVTYLCDLKLFGIVFALPSSSEPAPSGSLCRAYMEAMWNLVQSPALVNFSSEERRHALYAALLLPFRKMVYKDNKGKLVPVVNYILKDSLKRKSTDAETVVNIHRAAGKFLSLILPLQLKSDIQVEDKGEWEGTDVFEILEYISRNDPDLPATWKIRVLAGFLLRDIKELWRVALLTSLLLCTDDDDKKREMYQTIEGTLCDLSLDTIWNLKPLVDGSHIIKALQLTNRGHMSSIIREWQHKLLAWQLVYPRGMPLRQRQAKR